MSGEALPRLLLIADGFAGDGAAQRCALDAVEAGVPWVQLRDHGASAEAFEREAERFVAALRDREPDVAISVNTHAEIARRLGLGLHVGRRGPSVAEARAMIPDTTLSAAVHSVEGAIAAAEAGADAVLFSPVFPTTSKPGQPAAGLDALAACCAAVSGTPVYALGGVTPARVADCLAAGAHGAAVLSGILHAADPATATVAYLTALRP